jgi:hypothetical protein
VVAEGGEDPGNQVPVFLLFVPFQPLVTPAFLQGFPVTDILSVGKAKLVLRFYQLVAVPPDPANRCGYCWETFGSVTPLYYRQCR